MEFFNQQITGYHGIAASDRVASKVRILDTVIKLLSALWGLMQKFRLVLFVMAFHAVGFSLNAFNVKVLLHKKNITDCAISPIELQSESGFILSNHPKLSIGYQYKGRNLAFTSKHGKLLLNGKPLQEKLVHISVILSHGHQIQLKSNISCWLETCRSDLYTMAEPLYALFDAMVASDVPLPSDQYDVVNKYAQNVCLLFLHDALKNVPEDSSISTATLQDYTSDFLEDKPQKAFALQLAAKHLTSDYRKILQKDKKKRYAFFSQELFTIMSTMLVDCVMALPRKLLQQILQDQNLIVEPGASKKYPFGFIEYEDYKYLGSFLIFQDKKQVYIINSLDIDDYLLSVVRHEGWPGWPMEMNKVMAIACRTYLIWQVLQAQKVDRPYHIQNGIKHQTYKGYHECEKLKQAIDETKDLFVAYDGKPALTMYDACCGGIVPGNIDDPDYKRISYLARNYPCTFCKSYKIYNWSLDFSSEDVLKRLQKEFSKLEKINEIYVYKKDKAGLVKKVMIVAGTRKILISEKKMKMLFPELKSYSFDITKVHRRFMIEGKGFGHHRGLCQWGASHLVKNESWNCSEVLQFYYPGTTLMKLTYQR